MRAPDAPTGWPMPTAPPFTLTISCGKPSSRLHPTAIDANASLISTSWMSSSFRPARSTARGMATVGARPVSRGGTPAADQLRTAASGVSPFSCA